MTMLLNDVAPALLVGLLGGLSSGLLGVSPGGALVVLSVLLLGAEQHAAQGLSLIAQVPPASLSGIRRYRQGGHRSPLRWLGLLALGSAAGSIVGAALACWTAQSILRWSYVGYLLGLLVVLATAGRRKTSVEMRADAVGEPPWIALLGVGLTAGFSSGFLGIGGGLATVVGLTSMLRVPQHQAQMVSLILSLLPTTLPSAWVYWQNGWSWPWVTLLAVVGGLAIGSDLGARIAAWQSPQRLRVLMLVFVSVMAGYMVHKALS